MQFLIPLLAVLILGIILSKIDRSSIRGKQLLIYFYLAIAFLSLMRGVWVSTVLFGIFALWQWTSIQRLRGGYQSYFQNRPASQTKQKETDLPQGCPPDCSGQDLSGRNLQAANLKRANLQGANLFVADLRQANLSESNLEEVDLGGAKLEGADLRQANLNGADLRGAKYDGHTMWPVNFDPVRAGAVRVDKSG